MAVRCALYGIDMENHPYANVRTLNGPPTYAVDFFAGALAARNEQLEQERHNALHDPLTGLRNRNGFYDEIQAHKDTIESGGNYAMLVIDLDGFKAINDAHDHETGDKVLKAVADKLVGSLRQNPDDTHRDIAAICRAGGDEIWILVDLNNKASNLQEDSTQRRSVINDKQNLDDETKIHHVCGIITRLKNKISEIPSDIGLTDQKLASSLENIGFGSSIGGALARPGVSLSDLIDRADEMAKLDKISHTQKPKGLKLLAFRFGKLMLRLSGVSPRNADKTAAALDKKANEEFCIAA